MHIFRQLDKTIAKEVIVMRRNRQIFILLFIFSMSFYLLPSHSDAYGWGYKKNTKARPEVGNYEQILANHHAVYVDDTDDKVLYLTFDNGYEQGYTEKVLDVLEKHDVPATFFLTGHYVASEPALVKKMSAAGHIIGNHSDTHPDFTTMSKEAMHKELKALEEAVAEITRQKSLTYLRPPRGTFNEETLEWADKLGYVHVFWSLAFKDWETDKQKGWEYAYDQIMSQVHPGAIMLLHTVSKDNAEALDKVISKLKQEGYTFKSLDDLMIKKHLSEALIF